MSSVPSMSILESVKLRTGGEHIADRLVTAIALGEFVPGQRLPSEPLHLCIWPRDGRRPRNVYQGCLTIRHSSDGVEASGIARVRQEAVRAAIGIAIE